MRTSTYPLQTQTNEFDISYHQTKRIAPTGPHVRKEKLMIQFKEFLVNPNFTLHYPVSQRHANKHLAQHYATRGT